VGKAHRGGSSGQVQLVLGEPAQLGDGEGRDRHRSRRGRPRPGAELGDQVARRRGRAGVVPEQGGAYHVAGLVEEDHAVLLSADADGNDVVAEAVGAVERSGQGLVPGVRVDLGAGRVGSRAASKHRAVGQRSDHDLARLR
jgi:hypothetical protein